MAPEQARGKVVDKRADIWAFGCVLYEMLTGRRAFDGEDIVDVLGAVARVDPDWTSIPEATPPVIRRLVRRCLEKDRKRRMADISTAVVLIEELRELPVDPARRLVASRPLWMRTVLALVAAGAVAAIAGAGAWAIKPSAPPLVTRSRLVLPEGQQFTTDSQSVAISRDGTQLVYVANQRLFLRSLSELEARPIEGTDDPRFTLTSSVVPSSRRMGGPLRIGTKGRSRGLASEAERP